MTLNAKLERVAFVSPRIAGTHGVALGIEPCGFRSILWEGYLTGDARAHVPGATANALSR